VNLLNKISIYALGIIFLMSVSGIVVLQSHCSCTGDDHVSVYVQPETCKDDYHARHCHPEGGEEAPVTEHDCECANHTNDCGCNNVTINFYKLENEALKENTRIDTTSPVQPFLPRLLVHLPAVSADNPPKEKILYEDTPVTESSFELLIRIRQLKISYFA